MSTLLPIWITSSILTLIVVILKRQIWTTQAKKRKRQYRLVQRSQRTSSRPKMALSLWHVCPQLFLNGGKDSSKAFSIRIRQKWEKKCGKKKKRVSSHIKKPTMVRFLMLTNDDTYNHYKLSFSVYIRQIRIIRMIQPLTLIPKQNRQSSDSPVQQFSPSTRRRADSLVFSITSQKHFSPRDTILLDSRQEDVSKELQSLQMKLCSLENKVQHITTEHLISHHIEDSSFRKISERSRFLIDSSCATRQKSKQNNGCIMNRAGRIVKKQRSLQKTSKMVKVSRKSNQKSNIISNQSRNSIRSKEANNSRQLNKLRKVVNNMKQSIQRTQRSRSICSERLSASKSVIKNLKRQQKKNERLISKLRGDLKKSENIREKQKQVILRQQAEIAHYRQLLKLNKLPR